MAKRTDVPWAWEDRPEEWWRHVDACPSCILYFERPLPKELIADSIPPIGDGESIQDQEA